MHRRPLMLALLLVPAVSVGQAPVRPLQIEHAIGAIGLQIQSALGALSPDGRLMAYVACDPARVSGDSTENKAGTKASPYRSLGCDILVTSVADKTTRRIGSDKGGSWAPAWSPNGRSLAFESDRDGVARVWLWDEATGKVRRVSSAGTRSRFGFEAPQWMPDGKSVLVKLFPEGMTQEQLEPAGGGGTPILDKVAGSTLVLYRSTPPGADTARRNQTPPVEAGDAFRVTMLGDLAVMDIATGNVRRIGRMSGTWFRLSPDGTRVAFLDIIARASEPGRRGQYTNLTVIDIAAATSRILARDIVQEWTGAANWSPDGKHIAYTNKTGVEVKRGTGTITSPTGGASLPDADLYVVSTTGGEPRKLTGAPSGAIGSDYMGPLWNRASTELVAVGLGKLWRSNVTQGTIAPIEVAQPVREIIRAADGITYWSPAGGSSLYALTSDPVSLKSGYLEVDLAAGQSRVVLEGLKAFGRMWSSPVTSADGSRVVFLSESGSESPDLWTAGPRFASPSRLTSLNPALEGYAFGAGRLIEYRSTDGAPLRGALLLPAGYQEGRRYPLVVWVYASDEGSRNINRFGLVGISAYNMHMLTTRGYAVLWPDIPVNVGSPMRDLMKSVMPAIDKVVELGIADPDRLAVTGQSNGGYSTLSLIVQTQRFKGAIMNAGFGDLTGFYGSMSVDGSGGWHPWLEQMGGAMGAPPWEAPHRYLENSPIYYLDRITTPLIIQAGGADASIVPYSDQVFVGLKRLRKDVTYLRYAGEGHVLADYANLLDYWNRVTTFLEAKVKGSGPAIP